MIRAMILALPLLMLGSAATAQTMGDMGATPLGYILKFGANDDIDNVETSVWEGNDAAGPERCPIDTTAFTLNISSDNAGDTEPIVVQGLDANWDPVQVTVTLAGLTYTQVGTASNWMRINRAYNAGSTSLAGTVYLHIDAVDGGADGVPDTPSTDIKTVVMATENQTLQSCYTIPDGYVAYVESFCASNLGGGGADPITARIRSIASDGVYRTRTKFYLAAGSDRCESMGEAVRIPARTMIEMTGVSSGAGSNQNATANFLIHLLPVAAGI